MTLVSEIMEAMAGHVRKGGKAHRKLQRARLLKFAVFAQNRGQWSAEQVGEKTFAAFFAAEGLSSKTQQAYRQAWQTFLDRRKILRQQGFSRKGSARACANPPEAA